MGTILDDEFVIQMDDTPPFSWIIHSTNRFMNCRQRSNLDHLAVYARGNSFSIAEMARDVLGEDRLRTNSSIVLDPSQNNCIVTYSGQLKEALDAVESSENKGIVMSSGGVIKNIARRRSWIYIPLPKGYPTRFLFPEIFGCLLSLLGEKVEIYGLDEFIMHNAPSELLDNNVAKQLAELINDSPLTIIYDKDTRGLAKAFERMFLANSGIGITIRDRNDVEEGRSRKIPHGSTVFLGSETVFVESLRIGGFPYDFRSTDGYVRNVLVGELASLYLGILRSNEIELLDRELE